MSAIAVRSIGITGFGLDEEVCALTQDGVEIATGPRERLQLWAAASELLEALTAAEQCIGELPPTQARIEVMHMVQTALAKARGES